MPKPVRKTPPTLPGAVSPPRVLPKKFGRYEVRALLGEGAYGRVYRATDPNLGREVAVKVPRPEVLSDEYRERFEREARAAAGIQHDNVCTVFDSGTERGVPYLVMEFVDGPTLAEALTARGGPYPPVEAARLVRQLALGVAAAHKNGVIHRDLKPANVLLAPGGTPKVTDFGVARVAGDTTLTARGGLVGTYAYMPPEQAFAGDQVDPRADVYSLGVVLYELLTGRVPFDGEPMVILARAANAPRPAPSRRVPGIDPGLDAVCWKAMAKAAAGRYPTALDLADALEEFARRPGETAKNAGRTRVRPTLLEGDDPWGAPPADPPPSDPRHWRGWAAAVGSVAVVAGGVTVGLVIPRPPEPGPEASPSSPAATPAPAAAPVTPPPVTRLDGPAEAPPPRRVRPVWEELPVAGPHAVRVGVLRYGIPPAEMRFRWVPAGTFERETETGSAARRVTISRGFWVAEAACTDAQLRAAGGSPGSTAADRPAEGVSWNAADAACKEMARLTGQAVRLPTEAEWELATRAGLPVSPDGVAEWCQDDFLTTLCHLPDRNPVGRDPFADPEADAVFRRDGHLKPEDPAGKVVRGEAGRPWARGERAPGTGHTGVGFRVCFNPD